MSEQSEFDDFSAPVTRLSSVRENAVERLIVDIDGFEGPLDVLLELARTQKVDLLKISILELVEQYLVFMAEARRQRLELAADYLVMAAWLAYLKSRLLLPQEEEDEPTAEEMAARLAHQLRRLEAMREAAAQLMARDQMGRDMFVRGAPEKVRVTKTALYDLTLYELLKAYGENNARHSVTHMHIPRANVYSLDHAIERLEALIGQTVEWTSLQKFLPDALSDGRTAKSARASMFLASLELARQGKLDLRQTETYGPLMLRGRRVEEDF